MAHCLGNRVLGQWFANWGVAMAVTVLLGLYQHREKGSLLTYQESLLPSADPTPPHPIPQNSSKNWKWVRIAFWSRSEVQRRLQLGLWAPCTLQRVIETPGNFFLMTLFIMWCNSRSTITLLMHRLTEVSNLPGFLGTSALGYIHHDSHCKYTIKALACCETARP